MISTMRRSPRRPLILKRRKLPFQQKEATPADAPSKSTGSQRLPDGVCLIGHPSLSDTQVVVIPKATNVQSVISALASKGKDGGVQGPSKFILLSENGTQDQAGSFCKSAGGEAVSTQIISKEPATNIQTSHGETEIKPLSKDGTGGPLDDSLTNIQWLGKMNTCALVSEPAKQTQDKENQVPASQTAQAAGVPPETKPSDRPPYSYMAMIQFAINSGKNRRMTLKEIYTWIEDHFPYYRQVAKPGWKNSIRHNLSLHDMFVRETAPDGKVSFWTIRPEANRCLTLDQVYKPGCDPVTAPVPVPMLLFPNQSQKKIIPDGRKIAPASERRMKPLLPRTDSYLVPIQLPVAPPVYLPSFTCTQQRAGTSQAPKRVRISPKVTQTDAAPPAVCSPVASVKVEMKEEPVCVPLQCETPKCLQKRRCSSSSRRKQCLVNSTHEEPVLLCSDNSFLDSGVVSDASTFQEVRDVEPEEPRRRQDSPDRDFSFKTPIKSGVHLTSSTPSKPSPSVVLEPWRVTPVGKGNLLDVSPIRTPGGPALTPVQDYTTFSLSSTPFKDVPLFSSPRELLTCEAAATPVGRLRSSCSRELLQGGGGGGGTATPANRSLTEGLMLDLMNDSLSKILVDISFSGMEDEDLGTANISLSDFINQLK